MAAQLRETSFADAHLARLDEYSAGNLFDLIEKFRQHVRLQRLYQPSKGETHLAFATNFGPSFREKKVPPTKPCLCGESHWMADCYYLIPQSVPKDGNLRQINKTWLMMLLKIVVPRHVLNGHLRREEMRTKRQIKMETKTLHLRELHHLHLWQIHPNQDPDLKCRR